MAHQKLSQTRAVSIHAHHGISVWIITRVPSSTAMSPLMTQQPVKKGISWDGQHPHILTVMPPHQLYQIPSLGFHKTELVQGQLQFT